MNFFRVSRDSFGVSLENPSWILLEFLPVVPSEPTKNFLRILPKILPFLPWESLRSSNGNYIGFPLWILQENFQSSSSNSSEFLLKFLRAPSGIFWRSSRIYIRVSPEFPPWHQQFLQCSSKSSSRNYFETFAGNSFGALISSTDPAENVQSSSRNSFEYAPRISAEFLWDVLYSSFRCFSGVSLKNSQQFLQQILQSSPRNVLEVLQEFLQSSTWIF